MSYNHQAMQDMMRQEIPLCDAMELAVPELTERQISVSAPMSANKNNHGSFFAGSLYSLAAITGWGLLTNYAHIHFPGSGVVVRKGEIDYLSPVIEENIRLNCQLPDNETLALFNQRIQQQGKARLDLTVELMSADKLAIRFRGTYTLVTAELISLIKEKQA